MRYPGVRIGEIFLNALKNEDPEIEVEESVASVSLPGALGKYPGVILTEDPISLLLISAGTSCAISLSPTVGESALASSAAFLGKKLAFLSSYSISEGEIELKVPETMFDSCLAYLSDPNFPTGRILSVEEAEALMKFFDFLLIDSTYSFMLRGNEGDLIRREHEALLNKSRDNLAFILRLHKTYGLKRYPAYLVISSSHRFLETLLMLVGWTRNGISSAYMKILSDPIVRESVRKSAQMLNEAASYLKESLRKLGWETVHSDMPYFLIKGSGTLPSSIRTMKLNEFVGISHEYMLAMPMDSSN
ncbi:MAG: aminotransferase class I/II-fold pyridoxal phosphate-dependent enzyme [Fervidicoccaceae archaeon]